MCKATCEEALFKQKRLPIQFSTCMKMHMLTAESRWDPRMTCPLLLCHSAGWNVCSPTIQPEFSAFHRHRQWAAILCYINFPTHSQTLTVFSLKTALYLKLQDRSQVNGKDISINEATLKPWGRADLFSECFVVHVFLLPIMQEPF